MILRLALLCVALISQSSYAAEGENPLSTGNTIYPVCTSSDAKIKIICTSYVAGVVAGVRSQAAVDEKKPFFCLPENHSIGQIEAVFIKYLNDHPEERHIDTASLVQFAMIGAFRCKKS